MANFDHVDVDLAEEIAEAVEEFCDMAEPLSPESIIVLVDGYSEAPFTECHVKASKLLELATVDVALDPDHSPEYRANRDIVENHAAYRDMVSHAQARRYFSNIVAEYQSGEDQPIKIIGGQHRFKAIEAAVAAGVDEVHGLKIYFNLSKDQRLDVQVISNTNIAVSRDLLDRMYETLRGSDLRDWCQKVGFLDEEEDFSDKRSRGAPMTVRQTRTFIQNYFAGFANAKGDFALIDTTPKISDTGSRENVEWDALLKQKPSIFKHKGLEEAATRFAELAAEQFKFWAEAKAKQKNDFGNKANNMAIVASWAYVAGLLNGNKTRLERHFALTGSGKKDPFRADLLVKGRHASDPDTYRGLGYRQDAKERGRFVELFYIQGEKGTGFSASMIDAAISAYHAKQAQLEAQKKKNAIK